MQRDKNSSVHRQRRRTTGWAAPRGVELVSEPRAWGWFIRAGIITSWSVPTSQVPLKSRRYDVSSSLFCNLQPRRDDHTGQD